MTSFLLWGCACYVIGWSVGRYLRLAYMVPVDLQLARSRIAALEQELASLRANGAVGQDERIEFNSEGGYRIVRTTNQG